MPARASGDYTITIHGKAAHQGIEPDKGRNAIVSAAHLIQELVALQALDKGTTLGPNVLHGGTVSNVVPDEATLASGRARLGPARGGQD